MIRVLLKTCQLTFKLDSDHTCWQWWCCSLLLVMEIATMKVKSNGDKSRVLVPIYGMASEKGSFTVGGGCWQFAGSIRGQQIRPGATTVKRHFLFFLKRFFVGYQTPTFTEPSLHFSGIHTYALVLCTNATAEVSILPISRH